MRARRADPKPARFGLGGFGKACARGCNGALQTRVSSKHAVERDYSFESTSIFEGFLLFTFIGLPSMGGGAGAAMV